MIQYATVYYAPVGNAPPAGVLFKNKNVNDICILLTITKRYYMRLITLALCNMILFCTISFPVIGLADSFKLNGSETELYFSPKGGTENAVIKAIGGAKRIICVLAYSFTSTGISDALEHAHKRGVKVLVVLDRSQLTAKGSKIQNLQKAGIPVFIDDKHAIAHNKVMILDNRRVITGSFNFTRSAEDRNAENLLIIKSQKLAKKYKSDFDRHMAHARAIKDP